MTLNELAREIMRKDPGNDEGDNIPFHMENTIRIPEAAFSIIEKMANDQDAQQLPSFTTENGIASFAWMNNNAAFVDLEHVLIHAGIPFIHIITTDMVRTEVHFYEPAKGGSFGAIRRLPSDDQGRPYLLLRQVAPYLEESAVAKPLTSFIKMSSAYCIDLASWNDRIDHASISVNAEKVLPAIHALENHEVEEDEMPFTFSDGTISIPSKAMEIITQVPRIDLDVGAIRNRKDQNGVTTIVAQGACSTFDGLEDLLIKLEIPFVRTATRDMVQHEIRYYAPTHDGKSPVSFNMPCNERGEPFITMEELMSIMDGFGEQGLANTIRKRLAMTKIDLSHWNNSIDVNALSLQLCDIYVSVRAYKDAQTTYPKASEQRCQAYANCMAMLTDLNFTFGLGYQGPSARQYAMHDAVSAGKYPEGTMTFDDARQILIDPNGPIFGPMIEEIARYIREDLSNNDCPEDICSVNATQKQFH